MKVSALYRYPIKSCQGERCVELEIGPNGPVGDREFMVVNARNPEFFITQRDEPRLAQVRPEWDGVDLFIQADGVEGITLPRKEWGYGLRVQTTVHGKECVGIDQGEEAAEWFSDFLGGEFRLLWMPDDHFRRPNRLPSFVNAALKFADGYPLLLTSEASLKALNDMLPSDLPPFTMDRFRPNIVVDGDPEKPWEEETWNEFFCGGMQLFGVKPCDRCAIITTHQQTGERTPRLLKALLKAHSGVRVDEIRETKKTVPLFGMNLIPERPGAISEGYRIEHIQYGERPPL